jgi:hypothetical protein
MTRALGGKSGRGKGSFIADTRQQVIDFYSDAVQNLTPWQAKAPKLPPVPEEVPEAPQPDPPPFVAAGGREVGEASLPNDLDEEPDTGLSSEQARRPWGSTDVPRATNPRIGEID